MKKAKKFLANVMTEQGCKKQIKEILDTYPHDVEERDLKQDDLKLIIAKLKTIIRCNKENNTLEPEDIECLTLLEKHLK